jgi:glutathione S-transferase
MDDRIAAGRRFMLGDAPGLPDALAYYLVWFVRGRYAGGPELLSAFPALVEWESRVRDLGHGKPLALEAGEALAIARDVAPVTRPAVDSLDPLGLTPGQPVRVGTEIDDGSPEVAGDLVVLDRDEVAIARSDPRVGEIVVHFPRVGYRVANA